MHVLAFRTRDVGRQSIRFEHRPLDIGISRILTLGPPEADLLPLAVVRALSLAMAGPQRMRSEIESRG
jgi:hypothetical protein